MRFLIKLNVNKNKYGNILPMNYQYELSSTIYKILFSASEEYAKWLHDNGYRQIDSGKTFKMFNFSRLYIPQSKVIKGSDRIVILSQEVSFYISFLPDIGTEKFITGIFSNRIFNLGDSKSKVAFEVLGVEAEPSPLYNEEMECYSLSPIVISKKDENGYKKYLSPHDCMYEDALEIGIKSKYEAFYGNKLNFKIKFELLTEPKSSLVTIKSGTPEETKVRGYNYSFKIKAPVEIQKVIYEAGIGELCSQGFGCVKVK